MPDSINRPSTVLPCRCTAATVSKAMLVMVAALSLLFAAIGLILYGSTRHQERTFHGNLADILPPAPPGWTRTARPIADTPEMKKAVGELLDYDQGVFYDYTKANLRLSVYVAYWTPGRMTYRAVANHTPDVCWVKAGWECTARSVVSPQTAVPDSLALSSQLAASSSEALPAESRTFTAHGTTEYVWFWHLVNGTQKSYGTGGRPPWYAPLVDMLHRGINQRSEQFFIRLSSPQLLSDTSLAPIIAPVLQALPLQNSEKPGTG